MAVKTIQAPILERRQIAEGTFEVRLDVSKSDFHFQAGQYVAVVLPELLDHPIMDKYHDFSISSSPNTKDYIAITFRESKSVFKQTLMTLPIGTPLTIEGPKGILVLPESIEKSLIFIAGGVGITAYISMMRFVSENKLGYKINLLYFNSSEGRTTYKDEILELSRSNPNLLVYNFIGQLDEEKLRPHIQNLSGGIWYVVGPEAFVFSGKNILTAGGIGDVDIITEQYSGY